MTDFLKNNKGLLIAAAAITVSAPMLMEASFSVSGFVFAIDVVVLNVCIYYFVDDCAPMQLAFVGALCSPISRCLSQVLAGHALSSSFAECMPDAVFFFTYGVIVSLILSVKGGRNTLISRFAVAVCAADILGNTFEAVFMTMVGGAHFIDGEALSVFIMVGVSRTIASVFIVKAMAVYSDTRTAKEQERNTKYIISHSAFLTDELSLLKSNKNDVERVVKEAYELYGQLRENEETRKYANKVLNLAMATHEIKGGYNGFIDTLNNLLRDSEDEQPLKLSDILAYDRADVQARGQSRNIKVEVNVNQKLDFYVKDAYKVISIVRNLTTNAVEAMNRDTGTIDISVELLSGTGGTGNAMCHLVIRDDGPGMSEDIQENVFLAGFSTKMNMSNGFMQRGLGLPLVKEYVEEDFGGSLEMESSAGFGTKFVIDIPINKIEGGSKWIFM